MKNIILLFTLLLLFVSCNQQGEKTEEASEKTTTTVSIEKATPFFKLSLAQWSLHTAIWDKTMSSMHFAKEAKEMGFEGLEYVSGLYGEEIEKMGMPTLLDSLKSESEQYGMKNLLIMVDGEGELANPDVLKRDTAVENHKKWVDAAAFLDCHSIRVNLFGTLDSTEWKEASIDGLSKLAAYAKTKNINVIVENHGYLSSNAALLVEVMKAINVPNCGTLPDFGNFCLLRGSGKQWDGECIEEYDKYQGVAEMMPYAKAVSAKSYDFDEAGIETKIDYTKMLQIVKNAGYKGYIGVEYEGSRLSEKEGILATKALLLKLRESL